MRSLSRVPFRWPASCLTLVLSITPLLGGALQAQRELVVAGIPEDAPFTVRATADPSRLVVELDLKEGWHAYSRDVGGGDPIRLAMTKGSAITMVGKLRLPADKDGELYDRVRIEQWLKPDPGEQRIEGKLSFMVCDPLQCLPPIELTISGKVAPLKLLLVVPAEDEHAARIEKFLMARGFAVQVTTYPEVNAEVCDAHDLVLADSKLFRKNGKAGRKARSFPKTKAPIIAVGFLGTQLIEAQGLAMTSGYI